MFCTFPFITASGCLLTFVVGAFASIAEGNIYEAIIEAVTGYSIAAERAMDQTTGPGSFMPAFLDRLYL